VKIPPVKANKFQIEMLRKYAFFNFAKRYAINHKIGKDFQVEDAVMKEFREFLDSEKVQYTEADLKENEAWVRSSIKSELFVGAFGQRIGMQVQAEADPVVMKALELIPKAKELADTARKTIAARNHAQLPAQSD